MTRTGLVFFLVFLALFLKSQEDSSLVSRYLFNKGDARDDLGKNNAKAYGISWTEDRFGNERSACYLQGNFDSYLNLGSGRQLKVKNGSISIWVNIDQAVYKGGGADNNPIVYTRSHGEDSFNEAYIITYQFNIRKLCCNTSFSEEKQVHLYPTRTTYLRKWYHVVMTYDDKALCLYINGILEGKAAKNFESRFLEGDSVIIGVHNGKRNQRCFQGCVDDIYIYNKVLSLQEVSDLYNAPDPNGERVILKWVVYCGSIIIFILLLAWLIKWRINRALRKEKEKNQLRNNWFEQENKVLTAQMDPHFIFNSLNTIQQFIIINDNEKAQLYLTKFSRLLRMILESNVKDSVTLKEEIRIIEQYLEIESLRFNNVFKYQIFLEDISNTETINIPRFLIQPFVENAIWHGLLPKDGEKLLTISFKCADEKSLTCIVEDNGVGRKISKIRSDKTGNKSLAINFIKQRLELMSKLYNENYYLVIKDKIKEDQSDGTRAEITLPILKKD